MTCGCVGAVGPDTGTTAVEDGAKSTASNGASPPGQSGTSVSDDDAIRQTTTNTPESQAAREKAQEAYGGDRLADANDPVPQDYAQNAASVDPWIQYIPNKDSGNAPLHVKEITVTTEKMDGTVEKKTFSGAEIADLINKDGGIGASYNFRDNSTEPLAAVANADGTGTISQSDMQKFIHLFPGGSAEGVKNKTLVGEFAGEGSLQAGIDAKTEKFATDFQGAQSGFTPDMLMSRNGAYQALKPDEWTKVGVSLTS